MKFEILFALVIYLGVIYIGNTFLGYTMDFFSPIATAFYGFCGGLIAAESISFLE